MRKVNLRNVDPAIDDPDASTWCKLEHSGAKQLFEFQLCLIPICYSPPNAEPTLVS